MNIFSIEESWIRFPFYFFAFKYTDDLNDFKSIEFPAEFILFPILDLFYSSTFSISIISFEIIFYF